MDCCTPSSSVLHYLVFILFKLCKYISKLSHVVMVYTMITFPFFFQFYLFLAVPGLWCTGFSPVAVGGFFLTAVDSLVEENGLWGMPASVVIACGLSSCSFWALEYGLNSCRSWASLLHSTCDLPRSSPSLLHWQADSLPLSHQGSCTFPFLLIFFLDKTFVLLFS